mgnify:CR=1 FL=1
MASRAGCREREEMVGVRVWSCGLPGGRVRVVDVRRFFDSESKDADPALLAVFVVWWFVAMVVRFVLVCLVVSLLGGLVVGNEYKYWDLTL